MIDRERLATETQLRREARLQQMRDSLAAESVEERVEAVTGEKFSSGETCC